MDKNIKYDVCIVGLGPAGLTSAIYAARAGKKVCVFGDSNGQLGYSTMVENYPGFAKPIMGPKLMDEMRQQALHVGANIIDEHVDELSLGKDCFKLTVGEDVYSSKTCVIATGSKPKWLGLSSEETYKGYGVSSCATCDGYFYKDQTVVVVGGGNTAVEEAIYLSSIAAKVILVHRRDELRADHILQKRLFEKPNVEIMWDSEVQEVFGKEDPKAVTGVLVYNNKTQEATRLDTSGLFIAIGHSPQNHLVKDILELKDGYVKSRVITKIQGLFVAGDVADSIYRQAITAAGDGCRAAMEAIKFIESKLEAAVVRDNTKQNQVRQDSDRPNGESRPGRGFRGPRSGGGRGFGDRPRSSDDRPRFGSDRPRTFGDRPRFGEDRPRPEGDRPRFGDDRPRTFGDGPRSFGDRPRPEGDRPRFGGGGGGSGGGFKRKSFGGGRRF